MPMCDFPTAGKADVLPPSARFTQFAQPDPAGLIVSSKPIATPSSFDQHGCCFRIAIRGTGGQADYREPASGLTTLQDFPERGWAGTVPIVAVGRSLPERHRISRRALADHESIR